MQYIDDYIVHFSEIFYFIFGNRSRKAMTHSSLFAYFLSSTPTLFVTSLGKVKGGKRVALAGINFTRELLLLDVPPGREYTEPGGA